MRTRLQREWSRLYMPSIPAQPGPADPAFLAEKRSDIALVAHDGSVRAMVLELARPASWPDLQTVWQGVQAELGLPAPAIAVSGQDGIQLWFSLAAPLPARQAAEFLEALRRRYLDHIPAHRLALRPALDALVPGQVYHASPVPAEQAGGARWSAFVAPDLAAVFEEEPWLALCPNPEGQASLLAGLSSTPLSALAQALAALLPQLGRGAVRANAIAEPPAVQAVQAVHAQLGAGPAGAMVEATLSRIALGLVQAGVRQLVVAGGETSRAAVQTLGVQRLAIGAQIAPGVPWTAARPAEPG